MARRKEQQQPMNPREKASTAKPAKRVPVVRLENIPRFRNEAEEAAWWDAHPEVIVKAFERAYGKKAVRRVLALKSEDLP
ncbi:MAG: hypothetical protein HY651_07365 [Acidobacteria bacterium]|nr:hypothetical protein [Acidobacteriota bacterium]